jgi:LysM repeat protein
MHNASNGIKQAHIAATTRFLARGARLRISLRAGVVVVVVIVATHLLTSSWVSAWVRVAGPGPASVDELLTLVAASLAIGVAAWLVCVTGVELAAHLPGRLGRAAEHWSQRVTPAVARRAAGFVLGVGVGVVGAPAQALASGPMVAVAVDASRTGADPAPDPGFHVTTSTTVAGTTASALALPPAAPAPTDPAPGIATEPIAPGFTPAAPRVRAQADPTLLGSRVTAATPDEVVVHRGDSLWSIAARHLDPDASAAEVDRSWRQWFSLNRDRIGPDPDLIRPGQVLRAPGPGRSASTVR